VSPRATQVGRLIRIFHVAGEGFREQVFFLLKSASEILHAPQTRGRSFLTVMMDERKGHRVKHVDDR
jgi:hypothetical protein